MFNKKLVFVVLILSNIAACDQHRQPPQKEDSKKVSVQNVIINFSSDNYKFRDDQKTILDQKVLSKLKSDSSLNVIISGYANDKNSPISDADMANSRAEYIKTYLVKNGIDAARIKTIGNGIAYTPKDEKIITLNGKVAVIKILKKI